MSTSIHEVPKVVFQPKASYPDTVQLNQLGDVYQETSDRAVNSKDLRLGALILTAMAIVLFIVVSNPVGWALGGVAAALAVYSLYKSKTVTPVIRDAQAVRAHNFIDGRPQVRSEGFLKGLGNLLAGRPNSSQVVEAGQDPYRSQTQQAPAMYRY